MREDQKTIALLIDADNMPADKVDDILNKLSDHGVINIRRAYGNWKKAHLQAWEERLHEFAIRPMQQFDLTKGKNASDMALVIDALDLLYTDPPDAFGLVSSDADFTPLVMYLRAKGAAVYGFGLQQTPKPFQQACNEFLLLGQTKASLPVAEVLPAQPEPSDVIVPSSPVVRVRVPTDQLRQDTRLVNRLRDAVQSAAVDGWAFLGAVGQHLKGEGAFDPRHFGYAKLLPLIEATQLFEIRREQLKVFVRDSHLRH
jgi:uncharacterized protein (TIGR00288 family)